MGESQRANMMGQRVFIIALMASLCVALPTNDLVVPEAKDAGTTGDKFVQSTLIAEDQLPQAQAKKPSPTEAEAEVSLAQAQASEDSSSSGCTDVAHWYDSDGPQYNCGWYGHNYQAHGHTANTACCACQHAAAPSRSGCYDNYGDYNYACHQESIYASCICPSYVTNGGA